MKPEHVAWSFVEAINAKRVDRLSELMTEDHSFIDCDGKAYAGRERMREGWMEYFAMVPDFYIEVEETLAREHTVAMFGTATGTFHRDGSLEAENHWAVPAAWRVVVDGGRVAVWQLYVNPEPMQDILKKMELP
jgi:ketosteroid isomerase-like protein